MPENNELEPNIYEVPHETHDVMDAIEKSGTKAAPEFKVDLNVEGIDKKASEVFSNIRNIHKHDSESAVHHEAGIPLPYEVKNEAEAKELVEKLIHLGNGDGNDLTETLQKIINDN